MSDKDVAVLKNLRGNLYYADSYMRDEMSELVIFDKGRPGEPLFHGILDNLRKLEHQVSNLIDRYGGRYGD